ncbi:MAG: HAMP domain-containing histidine kinase [Acidobacteria bacterium]|nr:HAMP domain-containing histidine kinase [Acidobacteriota bacterium]
MQAFRPRVSGVTALVVVVLLLVPALAWLQYRWVGQVSEAERERMQRTLRTSAVQFATAFDSELSRAVAGLQVEGAVARDENWTAYAQRYSAWTERALDTRLVHEVLLVDPVRAPGMAVDSPELRLRRWNDDQRVFEPAEWTGEVAAMRSALTAHLGEMREMRTQGSGRFRREGALTIITGDDHTVVAPITLFDFPADHKSPPRIEVRGFTLIRLDREYVRDTLLPTLATRHFHGDDGTVEFRMAVTDREDASKVIWESEPGAATAIGGTPDVEQAFMSPRPDQVFMITRNGRSVRGERLPPPGGPGTSDRVVISVLQDRREGGPEAQAAAGLPSPPERGRAPGMFEGRWRVVASHRAGSLEAAVAGVRKRNLMLSSGILLLLSTAIGLLAVSARRAQTLARQQMEFVAAVSHELRTPVSVIGTAAGNLADGVVADPARVRKYGETIQGEARRLGETVERVLQLAGIAAGSGAAAQAPVAVSELVQQSLAACRPEIDAHGVTLEVTVPDDLPPVLGDGAALRSALQNLISNAVKYGGDARWVRVEAAAADRSGLAAASAQASHVAISVADRGLGIGAEDRRHIFEPFYRGREAVSRQIKGSGLGLNLVSRIAEAHGGTVHVTSEPGKGSTFTLVLPAARGRLAGETSLGLVPGSANAG